MQWEIFQELQRNQAALLFSKEAAHKVMISCKKKTKVLEHNCLLFSHKLLFKSRNIHWEPTPCQTPWLVLVESSTQKGDKVTRAKLCQRTWKPALLLMSFFFFFFFNHGNFHISTLLLSSFFAFTLRNNLNIIINVQMLNATSMNVHICQITPAPAPSLHHLTALSWWVLHSPPLQKEIL